MKPTLFVSFDFSAFDDVGILNLISLEDGVSLQYEKCEYVEMCTTSRRFNLNTTPILDQFYKAVKISLLSLKLDEVKVFEFKLWLRV